MDAASAVLLLGGPKDHSLPLLHAYPGLVGKIYHVRAAAVPSWEGSQLPPPHPLTDSTYTFSFRTATRSIRLSQEQGHANGLGW